MLNVTLVNLFYNLSFRLTTDTPYEDNDSDNEEENDDNDNEYKNNNNNNSVLNIIKINSGHR